MASNCPRHSDVQNVGSVVFGSVSEAIVSLTLIYIFAILSVKNVRNSSHTLVLDNARVAWTVIGERNSLITANAGAGCHLLGKFIGVVLPARVLDKPISAATSGSVGLADSFRTRTSVSTLKLSTGAESGYSFRTEPSVRRITSTFGYASNRSQIIKNTSDVNTELFSEFVGIVRLSHACRHMSRTVYSRKD